LSGVVRNMKRRRVLAGGVAVMAAGVPRIAAASRFPERPITLIVPSLPGGGADAHMRVLATAAAKHLGQPILIENRPGGGGALAPAAMAATAKPDGYTLCQMMVAVFRVPHTQKVTFDPLKDFTYVIHVSGYLYATFVRADSPFRSMKDVLSFAAANPGTLTYGSAGPGSTHHIIFEQVLQRTGHTARHVPYRGEAEIYSAVLGGHVMVGVATSAVAPLVEAGQLRVLNTYGRARTRLWPDVPTAIEQGYGPVSEGPYGIAGPKGIDPEIVGILHDGFRASFGDPAHLAYLERQAQPLLYLGSEDYTRLAGRLYREQGEVLRLIGLATKD
jgi:tripartite-type tricarboxylate transporter receptor subunit TctC